MGSENKLTKLFNFIYIVINETNVLITEDIFSWCPGRHLAF